MLEKGLGSLSNLYYTVSLGIIGLQSILMCGAIAVVIDSLTLCRVLLCQALSLELILRLKRMENYLEGSWQVSPEARAQVDRTCLDWVLLGISHSIDFPHLNYERANWMVDELC